MVEVLHVIESNLNPNHTIKNVWQQFADSLRKVDADDEMISSMEKAFYMGAAQTFLSIDMAAKTGMPELAAVMQRLFSELDDHIMENSRSLKTAGSA